MLIVYVGPMDYGQTSLQRMLAMREIGHTVVPVNTNIRSDWTLFRRASYKIREKLEFFKDIDGVNKKLKCVMKEYSPDALWLDKAVTVEPTTLDWIRKNHEDTIIIGYSPDDMMNPKNQTENFIEGLSKYHIFFTTKTFNVQELTSMGCRTVRYIQSGYDPGTHRPMSISSNRISDVGFIGAYEEERSQSLLYLAQNNINLTITGDRLWTSKFPYKGRNVDIDPSWIKSEEYVYRINKTAINLCFLRKENRDLHTTRSVEIPACGGFMIAERTQEHLNLFAENQEAVYFSTDDELLAKVNYYLKEEEERLAIAKRGYNRCDRCGYDNHRLISNMLEVAFES